MPRTGHVSSDVLTVNEVALLAEAPERSVTKALEEGVLSARKASVPSMRLETSRKVLDTWSVFYVGLLHDLRESGWSVSLDGKKRIAIYASRLSPDKEGHDLELGGPIVLKWSKCRSLMRRRMATAHRYVEVRNRWIVSDDAIQGGTPVIRGTRMTVYSLLGRVNAGEDLDEIAAENPDIPREALEAALLFAKANPMRGRPAGRPWRKVA